ncbi:MAG: HlyD family efflux transporter periplasmic adaptor subunit [Phycisphaerales bacterium]|jgi:multidrug efflux pump subunit AcrA (membrane-fusion protein)|nr:HlyD family efflux transporter periplasmic adaptor subunit [Phycisphaerales bacterium]
MIKKMLASAVVLSMVLLTGTAAAPDNKPVYQYTAIARASEDITVSATMAVRVEKVFVKDGDTVKPDQPLVQLDDKAERVQMEQLKAQADDKTHVEAAEAQLAQKKVDLAGIVEAREKNAATELELQHAKLEVTISALSLKLSKFEHSQNQLKYKQAAAQVARLLLRVPTSDKDKPDDTFKVFKVFIARGESVDRLKEVIRIIKIDPLQIDVPVPETVVEKLKVKVKQNADVIFPNTTDPPVKGTIIYVADEIDAASGTQTVRVEIPNPTGRPAGKKVSVRFAPTPQ